MHEPKYPDALRVYTDFPATDHYRHVIHNALMKLVPAVYFGTDGRHLIREIDITYDLSGPRVDPSIVFVGQNLDGRSYCFHNNGICGDVYPTNSNDYISYRANHWCGNGCEPSLDPGCSCLDNDASHANFGFGAGLHEFGHCYHGLPDEYALSHPHGESCGHSIMRNTNVLLLNGVDYCSEHNGGYDPEPGASGHPSSESGWTCLEDNYASVPAYGQAYTPDAFWGHGTIVRGTSGEPLWPTSDWPFSRYVAINELN